ncbi:MAG: ATP-binding protein, partial [Acidimicrobiia bacterium]|nr:ATP-binding protein [Acidimicrobiia bacterium]
CGFLGDQRKPCRCRPAAVDRYRRRLSGPLIDRIDLVVQVGRVTAEQMARGASEESADIRHRVSQAREFSRARSDEIDRSARGVISAGLESGLITARGAARIRRVSRTIADLAAEEVILEEHVAEALALRNEW